MSNKKRRNLKREKEVKLKKTIKNIKLLSVILGVVLVGELLYMGYSLIYKGRESLYFDGINALESANKYSVTVGSNNDNDKFYEKAKISVYDDKREKVYEKLYNVGYNSSFFGVAIDGESIVAVGSYEKTQKDHDDSVRRALFVRYNSVGEVELEKDFKILDNSKFTSIKVVDDGYLVTGQSVYKNTKVGNRDGGAVLVKFNKDGEILWSRNYGSSKAGIYNDLLVIDDYIYTVGMDNNYLGIICKYDMDGNFIDYNDYKYTDGIGFSGITNIDDRIYVSGANRVSKDNTDAMIVEYDLDCNYIKQSIYTSKDMDRFNKIVTDDDDKLIVIGAIAKHRKSNSKTVDEFDYDGIIGKYNSDLEKIDLVVYGDERDDYFTDVKVVDGVYLVAGYSSYEDGSYLSKFIRYSDALKVLGVE